MKDARRGFSDARRGFSDARRGFSDARRGFSDARRGKPPPFMRGDLAAIGVVFLAALMGLLLFAPWRQRGGPPLTAEIYRGGVLAQTVSLADGARELRLDHESGYNLLLVGPEGIQMLAADCSNQDCVRAGLVSRPGGVLACLPHHLLVRLTGQGEGEFDAVAY